MAKSTLPTKLLKIVIALVVLAFFALNGFTVVTIQNIEERQQAETFMPESFVDEIWTDRLLPTVKQNAVDLNELLSKFQITNDGLVDSSTLTPIAEEFGIITIGQAHVYPVRGRGRVVSVDRNQSTGVMEVEIHGYDGPSTIQLFIGSRIPSDDSSVRDAVGFIQFGDFRDQTQFGQVAGEINRRIIREILNPIDFNEIVEKEIEFYGAFTIRTFNLIEINLGLIRIVPLEISIM